jgi:hypothetical protein
MPAIISEKFRIFNAKQFLESFSEGTPSGSGGDQLTDRTRMYFFIGAPRPWRAYMEIYGQNSTAFTVGGTVSATGGFTGTIAEVTPYALYFSVTSGTPTLAGALTGGGTSAGATAKVGLYRAADENNAPNVLDNQKEKFANYKDITALKRITETDVKAVIARYNYNISLYPNFDMWRPDYSAINTSLTGASSLATTRHIIMNSNYEVFMCIYNGAGVNGTNDIVKGLNMTANYIPRTGVDGTGGVGKYTPPGGQAITASGGIFAETDASGNVIGNGYMWKHLYTISTSDVLKFVSTDFIPVVVDSAVQTAATPASIEVAVIKDRGSNLPVSSTLYANVIGDGTTTAVVRITTNASQQISAVKVMNGIGSTAPNAGYTWGEVYLKNTFLFPTYNATTNALTGTTTVLSSATGKIEVIIPPQSGYGYDVFSDTNAKRVMTNVRLEGLDSLDFPVDNDFRRIGILQDPLAPGGTYLTSATASGLNSFTTTGSGSFTPDEVIYQSSTNAYGTVVSYDGSTGTVYYFQSPEFHRHTDFKVYAFTSGTTVLGQTSAVSRTISAAPTAPEVRVNSGEMIYVENRRFISRAADQIEDIKLVVEF